MRIKQIFPQSEVNVAAIFWALTLMLGSGVIRAETVYFDDADRGPANCLQIGGVTVTDTGTGYAPAFGRPTTVLGIGLGLDEMVGPTGEDNEQVHWPAGSPYYDVAAGGDGLSFRVDGTINSITIMPVLRIFSATGELMPIPDGLNLEFISSPFLTGGGFPILPAKANTPVTLLVDGTPGAAYSSCYLTPQPNWSPDLWFSAYRSDHLVEEQTLQWGFSVLSLDYTPAGTPEPNSATLLLAGLLGLFGLCHWRPPRFRPGKSRERAAS